jgi:hypothetical protein
VRYWLVSTAFVCTLLSGCGGATKPAAMAAHASSSAATPPEATVDSSGAPPAQVVRGCDAHHTGVGYGGVSRASLQQALRVGPLSLGALRTLQLSQLPKPRPGQVRFGAIESIAVIRAGASVTVAIPPSERRYVALIYDQSKFRNDGAYRISDLNTVVRFDACKDPQFNHGISQYDGGIVIAGRRCFTLDFYISGQKGAVRRSVPSTARCSRAQTATP